MKSKMCSTKMFNFRQSTEEIIEQQKFYNIIYNYSGEILEIDFWPPKSAKLHDVASQSF